jgi:hypothetical protein
MRMSRGKKERECRSDGRQIVARFGKKPDGFLDRNKDPNL